MKLYHQEERGSSNGYHSHESISKKIESLNWWLITDGALAPEIKKFPSNTAALDWNDFPGRDTGTGAAAAISITRRTVHHRRRHLKKRKSS